MKRIGGQLVKETKTHVWVSLNQPYWGAWKIYGWDKGTEGYGINDNILDYVVFHQKKLGIKCRGQKFEIGYRKLKKYIGLHVFKVKDRYLSELPRTVLDKVKEEPQPPTETMEGIAQRFKAFDNPELKAKLGIKNQMKGDDINE